jgi:hypothetical protein
MPSYKPEIIVNYADQLLSSAASVSGSSWLLGLLLGGTAGHIVYDALNVQPWDASLLLALLCSTIAAWLGRASASRLRGKAQQALCMLQIEENTRRLITMLNEREGLQLMVKVEAAAVQGSTKHTSQTNIITAVPNEP